MIQDENRKYGDIIQGDFIDLYENLTFKSLMSWRWIKYNCMKAQYFLKLDNDVFMNTRVVLDYITNKSVFNPPEFSLSGDIRHTSHPSRWRW
jgi:hypothetical protein